MEPTALTSEDVQQRLKDVEAEVRALAALLGFIERMDQQLHAVAQAIEDLQQLNEPSNLHA